MRNRIMIRVRMVRNYQASSEQRGNIVMHKAKPASRSARAAADTAAKDEARAGTALYPKASNPQLKAEFEKGFTQLSLALGLPTVVCHTILEDVDRLLSTVRRRSFTMTTDMFLWKTTQWLGRNSRHPKIALMFFAGLTRFLDPETNMLRVTRKQLANDAGITTVMVSRLMAELKSIGVIYTSMRGREVLYHLNVHVATKMPELDRRGLEETTAEPTFPQLTLVHRRRDEKDDPEDIDGEDSAFERTG